MKEKAIELVVKVYCSWWFNALAVTAGVVLGLARTGFVLLFLALYWLGSIVYKNNKPEDKCQPGT